MSWVFAGQGLWVRAPGGRRWSSLATFERPWTAQLRPVRGLVRLTAGVFVAARLSLSRRKPATTARQPTAQARVCLAAPPPAFSHAIGAVDQGKPRRSAREGDSGASPPLKVALADQVPTLLGVAIGAATSYLFTAVTEGVLVGVVSERSGGMSVVCRRIRTTPGP